MKGISAEIPFIFKKGANSGSKNFRNYNSSNQRGPEARNLRHALMGYHHHHHHPQASQAGEVLHSPGIWSTLEYPYCLGWPGDGGGGGGDGTPWERDVNSGFQAILLLFLVSLNKAILLQNTSKWSLRRIKFGLQCKCGHSPPEWNVREAAQLKYSRTWRCESSFANIEGNLFYQKGVQF